MANYKETTLAATTWQRAKSVQINNPYNQVPNIVFHEEQVINLNGVITTKDVGSITESLHAPATSFDLISPVDGTKIGTATYQDAYVILSSLYLSLAAKRDKAAV